MQFKLRIEEDVSAALETSAGKDPHFEHKTRTSVNRPAPDPAGKSRREASQRGPGRPGSEGGGRTENRCRNTTILGELPS